MQVHIGLEILKTGSQTKKRIKYYYCNILNRYKICSNCKKVYRSNISKSFGSFPFLCLKWETTCKSGDLVHQYTCVLKQVLISFLVSQIKQSDGHFQKIAIPCLPPLVQHIWTFRSLILNASQQCLITWKSVGHLFWQQQVTDEEHENKT